MSQLELDIHSYLTKSFLFTADLTALKRDASLLEQGILDSTGVLELVSFLEQHFGITVSDDELLPENLDSVEKIALFVENKKHVDAHAA
ncbi:MAG TPA: acyl carrier protein [Polyangiaceae bacterium]